MLKNQGVVKSRYIGMPGIKLRKRLRRIESLREFISKPLFRSVLELLRHFCKIN